MNRLISNLLGILLPRSCVCCNSLGKDLCKKCLLKLVPYRITHERVYSTNHKNDLSAVHILYPYDKIMRNIVHAGKYRNVRGLFDITLNMEKIVDNLDEIRKKMPEGCVLVPIPLSEDRLRQRGYNQAEYIARIIANHLLMSVNSTLLRRIKKTALQSLIKNKDDKIKNLANAFEIGKLGKFRSVVLIDDVITTGATMLEACKVLRENGVRNISGLVLTGTYKNILQ